MKSQWRQVDHMQIICTSIQTDSHASTSPLSTLQAGCPSCRPANNVKALKSIRLYETVLAFWSYAHICSWLLKECASELVPTITDIAHLALISSQFHHILKESVISPLPKKPTTDKDQLSNYRLISNHSLTIQYIRVY